MFDKRRSSGDMPAVQINKGQGSIDGTISIPATGLAELEMAKRVSALQIWLDLLNKAMYSTDDYTNVAIKIDYSRKEPAGDVSLKVSAPCDIGEHKITAILRTAAEYLAKPSASINNLVRIEWIRL